MLLLLFMATCLWAPRSPYVVSVGPLHRWVMMSYAMLAIPGANVAMTLLTAPYTNISNKSMAPPSKLSPPLSQSNEAMI